MFISVRLRIFVRNETDGRTPSWHGCFTREVEWSALLPVGSHVACKREDGEVLSRQVQLYVWHAELKRITCDLNTLSLYGSKFDTPENCIAYVQSYGFDFVPANTVSDG